MRSDLLVIGSADGLNCALSMCCMTEQLDICAIGFCVRRILLSCER